jgi:glycerol-3-phosphate acyltransferase PlsX
MRIVVDAMGSDNFPHPDIKGAVLAATEYPQDEIILVGQENVVSPLLSQYAKGVQNIQFIHAEQTITMEDKPSVVLKEKPLSSIHVGLTLIKDGLADAFVTAGNTGATHAIAMLNTLRRIPNVKRPALTLVYPILEKPVIFLDVGANAESKAEWLAQYALMGDIYAKHALSLDNPRIGLISNGTEEGKGTSLILETAELISKLSLNFIGNIEPSDIHNGQADVVITDGFVGNIMIKTFESSTRYVTDMIKRELKNSFISQIGALLSMGAFNRVRKKTQPDQVGGAPLLGVNGVVIVAHGSSNEISMKNAIKQARWAVNGKVVELITQEMKKIEQQL